MRIKDEIIFADAKVISDTSDKYQTLGDTDYSLNCCISDIGGRGIITNRKGNQIVSYSLPLGFHTFIGGCFDPKENKEYYFLYNYMPQPPGGIAVNYPYGSGIYIYDINTETIEPLLLEILNSITFPDGTVFPLSGGYLAFDKDHKIINPYVIDGKLYWTDGLNEPRKVNIEKALNFTRWILSDGTYGINYSYLTPGSTSIVLLANYPIFVSNYTETYDTLYQLDIIAPDILGFAFEYKIKKSLDNGATWSDWSISYYTQQCYLFSRG